MSANIVVSVIMSVFNGQRYIGSAIESILQQTFDEYQIVIVDDGSTDKTKEIVKKYLEKYPDKIKYIYQSNAGPSHARNVAIKNSNGKYIAVLDSDDISLPKRLEKQVEFLDKNPSFALVGSKAVMINDRNEVLEARFGTCTDVKRIKEELLEHNQFVHSSVVFRRSVLEECGVYREELKCCMDYELILRIAERFDVMNLDDVLCQWRVTAGSISAGKRIRQQTIANYVKGLAAKKELNAIERLPVEEIEKGLNNCGTKAIGYFNWAKELYKLNDSKSSFNCLIKALWYKPVNKEIWLYLFQNFIINRNGNDKEG